MGIINPLSIKENFESIRDPRIDRRKRHKLEEIIVIALCGVICGADEWVEIELFGNSRKDWFKGFLELPNGIPSHDTFGRVFAMIDPEQFRVYRMLQPREVQASAGSDGSVFSKIISLTWL